MKNWIIIVVMLLIAGCSRENSIQEAVNIDKKIDNSVKYERDSLDTTSYNAYVQAYNQITEVMERAVSEYKKACGLGDIPIYTAYPMTTIMDARQKERFDSLLQKPLLLDETGNPFSKEYTALYNTITPFFEIYEKTRLYYDRPNQDVTESAYLHKQFIICYVQFKNAYYDFSKSMAENYNQRKYEEMLHLKEIHLEIYARMYRAMIISKDAVAYLKEQHLTEKKKDAKEMLEVSLKEISQIILQLEEDDGQTAMQSGFSTASVDSLKVFIATLKDIRFIGTEEMGNIESIAAMENKTNDLVRIYNQFLK